METKPELQRIVDLVHRRDDLLKRRAEVVAEIDREIASIDSQLTSGRTPLGTALFARPADEQAVQQPLGMPKVKPGSHAEKVLRLKSRYPDITTAEMVTAVYGEDSPRTRHALLAVVGNLRKTGRWSDDGAEEGNSAQAS